MTPGQRSRLNTPIAARQRVKTVLEARTRGTEKTLRQSPIAVLKGRVTEYECKIAHLEQKLAKAQDDTSLFDLKRDPPMTSFGS
jgi:polyhydroxyalkanoate synthesis regulator phasin